MDKEGPFKKCAYDGKSSRNAGPHFSPAHAPRTGHLRLPATTFGAMK
jgi:hypothetical protein